MNALLCVFNKLTLNTLLVLPFDKDADCGVYSDENGVEFSVSKIIYNNTYHFGCSDDYLKTLLEEQGYIEHIAAKS